MCKTDRFLADMVQVQKKIALLHRYEKDSIKETNAAFPYLQKKGIDVLTFKKFDRLSKYKKFWKSILWIFYAPILVFRKNYDVIYCDDSYPFYPALVKLVSPKSKIVIRLGDLHLLYYYSGFLYEFLHGLEEIGWSIADEIICISEAMAERLRKEGYSPLVALDPVDAKDFPPSVPHNAKIVMFHGVLTKNKNLDVLLEAAKRLPDLDFIIIGNGPDLNRLINKSPNNVYFTGWVPFKDIPSFINRCAVGVALRAENPGNELVVTSSYLQYGIMGKPCLVTRRKVFGEYEWQFSTVSEMVDKIRILIKHPDEGLRLRKYVLENHSAEKIAGEIWEILTQV